MNPRPAREYARIAFPVLFTGGKRAFQESSLTPPVNNTDAADALPVAGVYFGATLVTAPTRIDALVRSTNVGRPFARSRNLDADTHPQVPTLEVSHYTICAPHPLPY